jgi:integrase
MARHGENLRKRVDGRWEGLYKAYSENKGRYVYHSVYGHTYDEAKEKLVAAKMTLQKNLSIDKGDENGNIGRTCTNVWLSDVAGEWLAENRKKWKYSTYIKYETICRKHLFKFLESHRLSDADSDGNNMELQSKISDHLLSENVSESMQKSICCITNQIFCFANKKYGLRMLSLRRPLVKTRKKTLETFTNSERMRLFSSIYDAVDKYGIAILLCLYTGLRIGELCALRWSDFNFEEMTLTVERTVQRIAVKNHAMRTILMEMEPKSEGSKRKIPISAEIGKLLSGLDRDEPYVFGGKHPLEPRTLQYRFKKMLAMAKIDDRNFHMLRHTFATSCIESGMDVKSLSEILGHSDVKITMNRYVHPTMDSKRKQLAKLAGFYGQIHGQVA